VRQLAVSIATVFFFAALASAQIPSGDVFFGYAYYNMELSAPNQVSFGRSGANGWEASAEAKMLPFLGLVADFNGNYPPSKLLIVTLPCPFPSPPTCGASPEYVSFTEHNYLFGPRVGVSLARFRPFAELLFGAGHMNFTQTTLAPSSGTSFATAAGVGLDYKLIRFVGVRLQADYVRTAFFGTTQKNARLATGIVLRF
jgi:hypothetical protein